jgi:zinc protease
MKPIAMIFMPEPKAPLVHLEFALLNGSLRDPDGKEGVASLTLSMLLRGTLRRNARDFHQDLDRLGAEIHLGKYKESMRIHGVVLADKLPAFLDLLEEMLSEPAFAESEFQKIRSQLRSSFLDELGSDEDIADRRFQEYLLWGNPYGKMTSGGLETLDKITVADLKDYHQRYFRGGDFVVGASGGFDRRYLGSRIKQILARLPQGRVGRLEASAPSLRKGKSLLLLDKPGRSQAQIVVGSTGVSFESKDYFAMLVANHIFGGSSFSARLMKEVREKRGWSYGAYSWYRSGRRPLYFAMKSVPSNKDAVPALSLMVKLFQDYARKGITKEEFQFAKKSLVNQSAFLQDTARKKLDNKVSEAVIGLPEGFYDGYQKRLQALTYAKVQGAIERNVDSSRIFALMLASTEAVGPDLGALKGFSKVWTRKFDEPPTDLYQLNSSSLAPRRGARKEVSSGVRP